MLQTLLAALPADISATLLQRLDSCDLSDSEDVVRAAVFNIVVDVQRTVDAENHDLNRLVRAVLSLMPDLIVQTVFANRT